MNGPDVITRTVWFEAGRFRTNKHMTPTRLPMERDATHEKIHPEHFAFADFFPPKCLYQVIYQRSERGDCLVTAYKRGRFGDFRRSVPVCFIGEWPVGTRFFRYVVTEASKIEAKVEKYDRGGYRYPKGRPV